MIISRIFIVLILGLWGLGQCESADQAQPLSGQFSYQYPIEIAHNQSQGFALNPCIEPLAKFLYGYLDHSPLFDTSFVGDPVRVKQYLAKKKHDNKFVGKSFEVYTDDGVTLPCTFFDRGSENLLIVGEGFTNYREFLVPFAAMFEDFDVVLFDFRGHGYNPAWAKSLSKMTFDVEGSLVTFGKKEHMDVYAVVDGFKRYKQESGTAYKNVFGLGVCYSALIFLKAAAEWPGLFDKLVLDGCWLSLPLFVQKLTKDLKAICNPQTGGWSDHWFFGTPVTQRMTVWLAKKVWGLQFDHDISVLDFASKIEKTKLLFIHGKDDYMIRKHEFETLWDSLKNVEKTAVLTCNPHVRNHWKQKELYRMICELFFADQPQEQFVSCLSDHNKCLSFYTKKLEFYTEKMARMLSDTESYVPCED